MSPRSIIATTVALVCIATAAAAADTTVTQEGQVFSQKLVTLSAGDTLTFSNNDSVRHNIRVLNDADEADDLGLQDPGKLLTYKFSKPGKYRARCGIHPSMKMTIMVQ